MAPLKILIVDDSPPDREVYKRFLRPTPFTFFEAESCSEALRIAEEQDLDCVIIDYNLPDGDGIDFIQEFQEKGRSPYAAMLMVTGQGSETTAVAAMKSGATDYISKDNIKESYFLKTIMDVIEKADLRKQVQLYQDYLEKSNVALSEFTHTVSHDLKAPLRRMISFCELLEESAGDSLNEESREYMERISANARRLQKFVDDLLAYSRVLHAHEDLEKVDLSTLARDVSEDLSFMVEETHAKIEIGDLPRVAAYPTRIRQLFLNLISNALKYHGEKKPEVEISCSEKNGQYVFEIADNGIGIPKAAQESVFNAFQRMHSQDAIEGTGLGLSICKKVVEAHKGDIWVESEPGKGSRFYFSLPKT